MKRVSLLLVGLWAFTFHAQAIVTFSLVGEVTEIFGTGTAFTVGDSVTVTMTTTADLGVPNSENTTSSVIWSGDVSPNPSVWGDVSLSGSTGTYTPANRGDLSSNNTPELYLDVYNKNNSSIGLSHGGEAIIYIDAIITPSGTYARYPGDSSASPETAFYNGTYALTHDPAGSVYTDTETYYGIQYTSLTITGALVPEPGTYALSFGVVVLLGVMLRRYYGRIFGR